MLFRAFRSFSNVFTHSDGNDENNNLNSADVDANDDLSLETLNVSTQKSIQTCFEQITRSPNASVVAGIYPILYAFTEYVIQSAILKFVYLICLDNSPGTADTCSKVTQLITESNPQVPTNVACIPKQWSHPKRFKDESDETKLSMMIKWILASGSHESILSGAEKITNIPTRLKAMKFNGYLRLWEIDTNILMNCMTESSWTLFSDFKTKHKDDAWKCPLCNSFFAHNQVKWKCERCIFFYHEKCAKGRKIKGIEDYSLCDSCFFAL